MKRSLLLAGLVALAVSACGKKEAPPPPPAPVPAPAPAPAPAQPGMEGMSGGPVMSGMPSDKGMEGMSGMSGGPVMNGKKEEPKK